MCKYLHRLNFCFDFSDSEIQICVGEKIILDAGSSKKQTHNLCDPRLRPIWLSMIRIRIQKYSFLQSFSQNKPLLAQFSIFKSIRVQARALNLRNECVEYQTNTYKRVPFTYLIFYYLLDSTKGKFNLPVDKLISMVLCRCPRTLNCGKDTSFETPTDVGPLFHLYLMSLIVYPTETIDKNISFSKIFFLFMLHFYTRFLHKKI